ncbi:MAG: lysophospholipid acyltransferase family protein [Planctomycetota bacterium]
MRFFDPKVHPESTLIQRWFFACCRWLCFVVLKFGFGLRTKNIERVPAEGSILLASNHQSFIDPPILGCRIKSRQTDFVARKSLFKGFGAWLLPKIHAFPIDDSVNDTAAIKETIARLKMGRAVVIFPEGSRTEDGAMTPYKRGIALILKRAKCPVMPVAVEGVFDAWPRHAKKPNLFGPKIEVGYGHPIPYDELMKDGPDAALERLARETDAIRLELRERIRERTGRKYPRPGPGDEPLRDKPSP